MKAALTSFAARTGLQSPSAGEGGGTKNHVCYVCTTCNVPSGRGSRAASSPDIEALASTCTTGAAFFHLLHATLIASGAWVDGAAAGGDGGGQGSGSPPAEAAAGGRAIDAGPDHRLRPIALALATDPAVTLTLTSVRCMSLCGAPHVAALRGGHDKFVYQFGGLSPVPECVAGLAEMVTQYCTSPDGYSSTRTRPACLQGRVSSRVPPLGGRHLIEVSSQ